MLLLSIDWENRCILGHSSRQNDHWNNEACHKTDVLTHQIFYCRILLCIKGKFKHLSAHYVNNSIYIFEAKLINSRLLCSLKLSHLDVLRCVIEEWRHLANGCKAKCGCLILTMFRYLSSCVGAIICDINTM